MDSKIAIVTLNWNGEKYLSDFLHSTFNQTYKNYIVIVVDNGSTDNSIDYIKKNYDSVILVENKRNLGYSKGFNLGIKKAINLGADYILIANNDLVLDTNVLNEALKLTKTDDKIGYMSGKVFNIKKRSVFQAAGGRISYGPIKNQNRGLGEIDIGQYEKVEDFEYMDDVYVFVSTQMINEIGAYDEDFFFYFEETEWNYRIRKKGWRIVYNPKMKVWHHAHGSSEGNIHSPFVEYHRWRGEVLFHYKIKSSARFLLFSLKLFLWKVPYHFFLLTLKSSPNIFYSSLLGSLSGLIYVIQRRNKTSFTLNK